AAGDGTGRLEADGQRAALAAPGDHDRRELLLIVAEDERPGPLRVEGPRGESARRELDEVEAPRVRAAVAGRAVRHGLAVGTDHGPVERHPRIERQVAGQRPGVLRGVDGDDRVLLLRVADVGKGPERALLVGPRDLLGPLADEVIVPFGP